MNDQQNREAFADFVKTNLGDIAVMDNGRYISPKINNYWHIWEARSGLVAEAPASLASGSTNVVFKDGIPVQATFAGDSTAISTDGFTWTKQSPITVTLPTTPLSDEHIEIVARWLETQMVNTPTNGPLLANALRHAGVKGVAARDES